MNFFTVSRRNFACRAAGITLVGYCDRVAVGFLGCRDAIPSLQRLAVYSSDALDELERALQPRPAARQARRPARARKSRAVDA